MAITHPNAVKNTVADHIVDKLDTGTADTKADCQISTAGAATPLVTIDLNDPAFGAASSAGVATLDVTPTLTGTAVATGTAAVFKFRNKDNTAIFSGTVGTGGGADLTMSNTSIASSDQVQITSFTYTAMP